MNLSPQKLRETVFLLLFSKDFTDSDNMTLAEFVGGELKLDASTIAKAQDKVDAITVNLLDIDKVLSEYSTSYDIHRIQRVEKTILRLALYELLFEKTVSKEIVISEAKRLVKKFSTPEASLFCQAILDAVCKAKK